MQRVIVQADNAGRMQTDDILTFNVRNSKGNLVPLSSFATIRWIVGPTQMVGFNYYPAVRISGSAKPGYTSGDAIAEMERIAGTLPRGFGFEWTGQSAQEKLAGSQAPLLLGLSALVVFLLLAALYESWTIPISVLLVVPLGMLGAVAAVTLRGMPNDVYFTIGLVTIIGLAAKDAILIIEFAKDLRAQGKTLIEAAVEAAHLRFRPILMTGFAFVFGVAPMVIASGASGKSQQALGTGVMGGMIAVVVLALLMVPVFFVVGAKAVYAAREGRSRSGRADDRAGRDGRHDELQTFAQIMRPNKRSERVAFDLKRFRSSVAQVGHAPASVLDGSAGLISSAHNGNASHADTSLRARRRCGGNSLRHHRFRPAGARPDRQEAGPRDRRLSGRRRHRHHCPHSRRPAARDLRRDGAGREQARRRGAALGRIREERGAGRKRDAVHAGLSDHGLSAQLPLAELRPAAGFHPGCAGGEVDADLQCRRGRAGERQDAGRLRRSGAKQIRRRRRTGPLPPAARPISSA